MIVRDRRPYTVYNFALSFLSAQLWPVYGEVTPSPDSAADPPREGRQLADLISGLVRGRAGVDLPPEALQGLESIGHALGSATPAVTAALQQLSTELPAALAHAVARPGDDVTGTGLSADEGHVDVVLEAPGKKVIQVIKVIRDLTGLALKPAKDLVDHTPQVVLRGVSRAAAEAAQAQLAAAGATVTLLA
jgi:large subunit ribosomal protein L7/L12